MTVWCVTASRPPKTGYTDKDKARMRLPFELWQDGDSVITGGCTGGDALAMQEAHHRGLYVVTYLPIKRDYTDLAAVRLYSDEVIETGLGYWSRDQVEVDHAEKVIALPLHERALSSSLSGTWHTWDIAGKQGKQSVMLIVRPQRNKPFIFGPDADSTTAEFHSRQAALL